MYEILKQLSGSAFVLDLGCAGGSFPVDSTSARTVRIDRTRFGPRTDAPAVLGDAASLPFGSAVFDAIVCNHGLEHFQDLRHSLEEIGRVLKPGGFLFVSVPDSGTLCDCVYRWLARGGGHVNSFCSAEVLAGMISRFASVPHAGTRTLCASFSFMNRKNPHPPQPKRMVVFLWGAEAFLVVFNALLRLFDRCFGSRASVYGWAMYFGNLKEPVRPEACVNVCVRCGQGHPSRWLKSIGAVHGYPLRFYRCPTCNAFGFYFRDECFHFV
jgi:SAM-dependent methyltransferase